MEMTAITLPATAALALPPPLETIRPTLSERRLLLALLARPGEFIAHEDLYRAAAGGIDKPAATPRGNVRATVRRLRAKLAAAGLPPYAVQNVHGVGYRWDQAVAERGAMRREARHV